MSDTRNLEQLKAKKKQIEALIRKKEQLERARVRKDEVAMGMAYWRFFVKFMPEHYNEIIKSKEFDEYLTSVSARKLFGFEVPSETPETDIQQSEEAIQASDVSTSENTPNQPVADLGGFDNYKFRSVPSDL